MMCIETFATLRIFSEQIHPEAIGERLEIDATEMLPIDPESPYRPRRETNLWSWSTEGRVESVDSLVHIAAIIERLKDKAVQLEELRASGCQTDICGYWVSSGQGGPALDVKAMASLHTLGLDIWWDIYFGGKSET